MENNGNFVKKQKIPANLKWINIFKESENKESENESSFQDNQEEIEMTDNNEDELIIMTDEEENENYDVQESKIEIILFVWIYINNFSLLMVR